MRIGVVWQKGADFWEDTAHELEKDQHKAQEDAMAERLQLCKEAFEEKFGKRYFPQWRD